MKLNYTAQIAASSGEPLTTVSKVLHHCPGIDTEVREKILKSAETFSAENCQQSSSGEIDIYVILPGKPIFFWKDLIHVLSGVIKSSGRRYRVKYNIYTKLGDTYSVKTYFNEAIRMNAKCVILACEDSYLKDIIEAYASSCAVFFICEETSCSNTFYFGSNQCDDGRRLAAYCTDILPPDSRIQLIGLPGARADGFFHNIGNSVNWQISFTAFPDWYANAAAANLASALNDIYKRAPFDAVVCLSGYIEKVCLALDKCRLDIPCFGFENSPGTEKYIMNKRVRALIQQDFDTICSAVVHAADDYLESGLFPNQKHNYISSILKQY